MELTSNKDLEVWFLTDSQPLYGEETLAQVAGQSQQIVGHLEATFAPIRIVWNPVLTTSEVIRRVCLDTTSDDACIGVLAWMHRSPAKMWLAGLDLLERPLLHLHTQVNRSLPWATIDLGASDRSSRRVASAPSPPISRISGSCANCQGWRFSGSWPAATVSAVKGIGRPRRCCAS